MGKIIGIDLGTTNSCVAIIEGDTETTSLIAVETIADGNRAGAYRALLERFSEEPGGAASVFVLDPPPNAALTAELTAAAPVPLRFADDPDVILARGAAIAPVGSASFHSANTLAGIQTPQLAYSEVTDSLEMPEVSSQSPLYSLSGTDPSELETDEEPESTARPRAPRASRSSSSRVCA